MEELPGVLWAYRTTPHVPTNEYPFNLDFGIEAIILVKIELQTMMIEHFDESSNSYRLEPILTYWRRFEIKHI